jgi:hypothetical protein
MYGTSEEAKEGEWNLIRGTVNEACHVGSKWTSQEAEADEVLSQYVLLT